MLTELQISHFAIIEQIKIHFEDGFNILSGETGAGKSILMKSLGLLMGGKSSQSDIQSGKEQALIEGAFELRGRSDVIEKLEQMGIDCEDELLIVRRLLQKTGKSRVYLNGRLSTISDLKKVVSPLVTLSNPTEAPLIEMTNQHENKNLLSNQYQMELLDQYCDNLSLRKEVRLTFAEIKNLEEKIHELDRLSQEREQKMDFLEFQIKEINDLGLQEKEDEVLSEKIKNLRNQEKWQKWMTESEMVLQSSDRSLLSQLKNIMLQTPGESKEIETILSPLKEAHALVEEAAYQLSQQQGLWSESDSHLDQMENRLSRIRKLQKKFGSDVTEILENHDRMKAQLAELQDIEQAKKQIQLQIKHHEAELLKLCKKLSKKRTEGASQLSRKINNELKDLNMKGLLFSIDVQELESPQSTGVDLVVFMTAQQKSEPHPLAKTASGGELSRILLSLKQVIGASQFPRTFLFDEVDTGVSGETAEKVGAKLKNLAGSQQVICVTHLPQVACFADHHYYIEKQPQKKGMAMNVKHLKKKERIQEIARLISGEKVTKTSLAHAEQLLKL